MLLEMFFNFDGDCREAAEFYAKVFKTKVANLMTYGDTPPDAGVPVPDADKDRIMYAGIPFDNMVLMCMDVPSGYPFELGNNISPTLSFADKAEVRRVFKALGQGGTIHSALGPSFFSELYGSLTDKFGINWQILHYVNTEEQDETTAEQKKSEAAEEAGGKARHTWSKEVSEIPFTVDARGAKATVYWPKRGEMLIKKGAQLLQEAPLNKDGSLGFSARGGQMIRDEHKDAIKDFKTTKDVILKSVNEVGLFLYFGGTNSWLELVDKDGKTINEWTVVA